MSSFGIESPEGLESHDRRGAGKQKRKGSRSLSRNPREVDSDLEGRVARLEENLANHTRSVERDLDEVKSGLGGMESMLESRLQEDLACAQEAYGQVTVEVAEVSRRLDDEVETLRAKNSALEELVVTMGEKLDQLGAKLAACEGAAGGVPIATPKPPKVDVPKPSQFKGSRVAKDVDNFLWSLEQYFQAKCVDTDRMKVSTASMYLTDFALVWWRGRSIGAGRGVDAIDTWETFQSELRKQFYPHNAEDEARGKLRRLQQQGDIRTYVREFTELQLLIPDLSAKDALFQFKDGLKPWVRTELDRREVSDLNRAIAVAESLVEYKKPDKAETPKGGGDKKRGFAKGNGGGGNGSGNHKGGEKKNEREGSSGHGGQGDRKWGKREDKRGDKPWEKKRPLTCFLCDGPHLAFHCPSRSKLTAIVKGTDEPEGDRLKLGSMLLSAVPAKRKGQPTGLMFVDVVVAGTAMKALVDTGASDLFLADRAAKRMGLKVEKGTGSIKTVNSREQPITGVVRGAEIQLGQWKGREAITVVPMDDYDVVLGLDFLTGLRAMLLPYDNYICILDPRCPHLVAVSRELATTDRVLSAIQLKKGVQQGEVTYLASLVDGEDRSVCAGDVPDEVLEVLEEFRDVMPPELPKKLPPAREVDHRIELVADAKPPARAPYRMSQPELMELRKQLGELIDAGFIKPSKSPFGAPVLFQRKQDGSLRMCVDYRALNKLTVKNRYPVPLIADLFDQLAKARWFSKLDLRSGYYQVRIAEGDQAKTACVTRYGAFEFSVMPFGLTNAPATFCTLMNEVLHPFIDHFVVVYLDDIVVYSRSLEEHVGHLRQVFRKLQEHELYVKHQKCSWAQPNVAFLGHVIGGGQIRMTQDKVRAILEWDQPTGVKELRSFLGLANYYRRFIGGYSAVAAPLTDMLRKDRAWLWDERSRRAFENLKQAISREPVLALPDFGQPFEVHTDASDFAIGGVLMQARHPIAFESRKLSETERRYTVQEKEMTAVVHCLRVWRHYLLGAHFLVLTDNVATSFFQSQKKLSPKQARWQDFLAEFDFTLAYKPGTANVVADALSRKACLAAVSRAEGDLVQRIRAGLPMDPTAKGLMEQAAEGKTRRFWCDSGLLYTKGNRLFVPLQDRLRKEVMRECHDSLWAGHPGVKRTLALVESQYFWPHMRDDVEAYVRTCLVCQQDKVEQKVPAGLLVPLPIAEKPWDSISMDFIAGLPKVDGMSCILVVVDRFSKYGTFIATTKECSGEQAARLFLQHVVKYWGLPRSIVSDRDSRFTGRFWTELFKLLGSDLKFSTSVHPQTDGQTERVNALLELYLRHFVNASQRDWLKLLDVAQFSYNLQRNESTGRSPFELVQGNQPLTPSALSIGYEGATPAAYKFVKGWQEQADLARYCLEKAAKRHKKWADKGRRDVVFSVGDKVLVRLHKFLKNRGKHQGLVRRYEGPFSVVRRVGEVAYKLDIPKKLRCHPVFHVSMLKPFHEDGDDPSRGKSKRAPIGVRASYDQEVQEVLSDRVLRRNHLPPRLEYLVRWKGLPDSEVSWEPADDLWQFEGPIEAYKRERGRATRALLNQAGEGVTSREPSPDQRAEASTSHQQMRADPSTSKQQTSAPV